MNTVNVTLEIPRRIAEGLGNGTLERVGGVIRDSQTKQVVAWLRETALNISPVSTLLQLGSAASVLNLGVSVMGFAVIIQRLNKLEQRLEKAQEVLNKINRKIDLGYYASFRAALELVTTAIAMENPETRKNIAIQAIGELKKADHIYTDYVDRELEQRSQIADEYLLTLILAYVAEARCYLELGVLDIATEFLKIRSEKLRPRIKKYVELLLSVNPAAYLHPQFKEQIDLRRLTRIYQWIDPTLDEVAVFEMQRENFFKFAQNPNKWVDSLPSAILDRSEITESWTKTSKDNLKEEIIKRLPQQRGVFESMSAILDQTKVVGGLFIPSTDDFKQEAIKRLPQVLEAIEFMIETYRRFEAFQVEVQAIEKLGISFREWLQLSPFIETKRDGADMMYIIPSQPLNLEFS